LITSTIFVGFKKILIGTIIYVWRSSAWLTTKEITPMHDILIALAFIGMVVAPAVVAAKSGSSEGRID
jgi:hypothetical protein